MNKRRRGEQVNVTGESETSSSSDGEDMTIPPHLQGINFSNYDLDEQNDTLSPHNVSSGRNTN